jgi:hypothetical protein
MFGIVAFERAFIHSKVACAAQPNRERDWTWQDSVALWLQRLRRGRAFFQMNDGRQTG